MPLKVNSSIDSLSVKPIVPSFATESTSAVAELNTLALAREASREVQPLALELQTSPEPRGLGLKSIRLDQGFEGFMQRIFNPRNELYVVALSWDFSGAPPVQHPTHADDPTTLIINAKVGQTRTFPGAGLPLFPARKVVGGLVTRIMLWESDQDIRRFGTTMAQVADAIQSSELTTALKALAGTNPTTATIDLVATVALKLTKVIGEILKNNSDDYVDYYEGFYPSGEPWTLGDEPAKAYASGIELHKFS